MQNFHLKLEEKIKTIKLYIDTNFLSQEEVQYHCKKGFLMVGEAKRKCSDSKWTGFVPLCSKLLAM